MQGGDGFTVEDRLARPDDGLRYELIDGSMIVSPPPVPRHQRVVNRLMEQMRPGLPHGLTLDHTGAGVAPSDRGAHQALVPDIVVTTWPLAGAGTSRS